MSDLSFFFPSFSFPFRPFKAKIKAKKARSGQAWPGEAKKARGAEPAPFYSGGARVYPPSKDGSALENPPFA